MKAPQTSPMATLLLLVLNATLAGVTRSMGKKKIKQKSKVKPFIRVYNYNHLMPTRLGI
ncbi:hypothetical protein DPMN_062909 [Dreissena polymorpha]|uniref:Ribosomal protein L27 n=1 Tax=Dreissena polymorpha TaxID=45954 RepID=A0A9D4HJN7_DREPO|nr:hypothetical protein DPMN_062909 [Dreissena polymorpha]